MSICHFSPFVYKHIRENYNNCDDKLASYGASHIKHNRQDPLVEIHFSIVMYLHANFTTNLFFMLKKIVYIYKYKPYNIIQLIIVVLCTREGQELM